jgi:hypothetical protein
MKPFLSTEEILKNPWRDPCSTGHYEPPPRKDWNHEQVMSISDVELWEEIYQEPGNIGIYAAWSPYAECYMIVYNFFSNSKEGTELFYGKTAAREVYKKCKTLGVDLSVNKIWVDHWNFGFTESL